MEAPRPKVQQKHLVYRGSTDTRGSGLKTTPPTRLESTIIDLYVAGNKRRRIARLLLDYLAPAVNGEGLNHRLQIAVRRLRNLEKRKWFRDLLWERAMIAADMSTPAIMAGVTQKATEGRVDAAKLVLGITGRYTEQGDVQATQVNVVFGADIPRPARQGIASQSSAEEHEVVEEAEWDE